MLSRLFAGGACAVGLLVAVSVMPAAAHPYDQYSRGRSLFATLFGPSIARMMVSYPTSHKAGTIVVSTAQRRLYLVLGNGQAVSYAIGVGRDAMAPVPPRPEPLAEAVDVRVHRQLEHHHVAEL